MCKNCFWFYVCPVLFQYKPNTAEAHIEVKETTLVTPPTTDTMATTESGSVEDTMETGDFDEFDETALGDEGTTASTTTTQRPNATVIDDKVLVFLPT